MLLFFVRQSNSHSEGHVLSNVFFRYRLGIAGMYEIDVVCFRWWWWWWCAFAFEVLTFEMMDEFAKCSLRYRATKIRNAVASSCSSSICYSNYSNFGFSLLQLRLIELHHPTDSNSLSISYCYYISMKLLIFFTWHASLSNRFKLSLN